MFGGIGQATIGQGGVYFLPGKYEVEVVAVKMIETRKKEDMFIVECLINESDNPERRVGTKAAYCCNRKHDSFLGNVKAFLAACNGADPENEAQVAEVFMENGRDTTQDVADFAIDEKENPLAGTKLGLTCVNKKTRTGGDFTLHFWQPREQA
jgi:hypothetical protein